VKTGVNDGCFTFAISSCASLGEGAVVRRKYKGFTLIEVMIVVAIIGILTLILTISLADYQRKTNDITAKADAKNLLAVLMR